jgi:hypothetical protein
MRNPKMHKTLDTYTVKIYIAGDITTAKMTLRTHFYHFGGCVTIEPTTFIYTGGEEAGMIIGYVNYPRFPSDDETIFGKAYSMAMTLIKDLNQKTALVVGTDKTALVSIGPPGTRTD